MRHTLLISLLLVSHLFVSNASWACSHDMILTVPDLEGNQEFLQALADSRGKVPKPFDLQATFSKKHEDGHDHVHDHEHDQQHDHQYEKEEVEPIVEVAMEHEHHNHD